MNMIRKNKSGGVSPVIGAMLILMLIVLFISWYQVAQVPSINQDFESDSNDNTINDLVELKSLQYETLIEDSTTFGSTTIRNTVSYPFQPAQPKDRIATVRFKNIENPYKFSNVDKEELNQENITNNTINTVYETNYLELTNRDYILENGILVDNSSDNKQVINDNQFLIRDTNIYLYGLDSQVNAVNMRNLEITVDRTKKTRTTVTQSDLSDKTQPFVFSFKSNVDATNWQNILDAEDSNIIQSVSQDGDYIKVELNKNYEYTIVESNGDIGV